MCKLNFSSHTYRLLSSIALFLLFAADVWAQEVKETGAVPLARARREGYLRQTSDTLTADSMKMGVERVESGQAAFAEDSLANSGVDEMVQGLDTTSVHIHLTADSLLKMVNTKPKGRFIPDPKKALWLAIVFPGGGQIYNRKYWKLPLVYGGFLGCVYAMTWNNTMYRDYSQAYIDITDSDENTKSYENFIPAHYDVNGNITRLQELFKRKKNYYRRYRDLSMFFMIGVYALSIVDAYVDAELSSFDISRDLSLKVHPAVINEKHSTLKVQGMNANSYGLQCSLVF